MSGNLYIALGKLREELRAYIELNINGLPKKNIYILLWRYENLVIQLEGIFIIALSKIAKNGIKEAVLIALFLPFSLNSQVTTTNNIPLAIKFKAPRCNRHSAKDSQ